MTLQQIQELTVSDVESTLLSRLELDQATQEVLEAELEVYKAELTQAEEERIAAEQARQAELARIADLKSRYAALSDKGLLQGAAEMSNPDAYFRDSILKADPSEAETNLLSLESLYEAAKAEIDSDAWLRNRQREYAKIDNMLLEAIAEKENGDSTKMNEYLALRAQVKVDHPKPE